LSSLFHLIYFNDEPKITDNDAKILQFAVTYICSVPTYNQEEVQTV